MIFSRKNPVPLRCSESKIYLGQAVWASALVIRRRRHITDASAVAMGGSRGGRLRRHKKAALCNLNSRCPMIFDQKDRPPCGF